MVNDPRNTKIIRARLPTKRIAHGLFVLNANTARKIAETGRLSAIAEYMGIIFKDEVLENPVAVFQGIKRPYLSDGLDNFVYTYVCNPTVNYYYAPRDRFDGTGPHEDGPPKDSVFVVFVSQAQTMIRDAEKAAGHPLGGDVRGVILSWECTLASSADARLPAFYRDRYRRPVWLPS